MVLIYLNCLIEKGYKIYGIVRRTSLVYTHTRLDHIRKHLNLEYGDLTDGSSLTNIVNKIIKENQDFRSIRNLQFGCSKSCKDII